MADPNEEKYEVLEKIGMFTLPLLTSSSMPGSTLLTQQYRAWKLWSDT
jgi:hypothetical protein